MQVIDVLKGIVGMLQGPAFVFAVSCPVELLSYYLVEVANEVPHIVRNAYSLVWVKLNNPSGSQLTVQPGPRHANSHEMIAVFECVVPGNDQNVTVQSVRADVYYRYQSARPPYPSEVTVDLRRKHFEGKIVEGDAFMTNGTMVNKSQKPRDFTANLVRRLESRSM